MNRSRSLGIGPVGAFMPGEDVMEPAPLVSREMLQAFGPSLLSRMREADVAQQQRWQAGERGPTPLTEDRVWLADDVAGSLLGPMGIMGAIKAYHGSPHRYKAERLVRLPDGTEQFIEGAVGGLPDVPMGATALKDYPLGRMRMDKIGTGEGAQAFGHGLYSSEAPGVAGSYRDNLSIRAGGVSDEVRSAYLKEASPNGFFEARGQNYSDPGRLVRDVLADPSLKAELPDELAKAIDKFEAPGALYTTRLDVEPEDLLDWDAPLSQQSEKVKKALGFSTLSEDQIHEEALRLMEEGNKKAGRVGGWQDDPAIKARVDELQDELDRLPPNITGADYYRGSEPDNWLHSTLAGGNSSPGMSEELRRRGIPGIKYLDQGSRASGEGTRNFVIFDDKLIDIEGIE